MASDLLDLNVDTQLENDEADRLAATVGSILGSEVKNVSVLRSEPSTSFGQHGLVQGKNSKVEIHHLLNAVVDKTGKIKKQIRKINHKKLIDLPLNTLEAQKIRRQVGYKEVVDEVSKWQPIVEQNRAKPQITFPLEEPSTKTETIQEKFKLKKSNPLKDEIDSLLKTSNNVITQNKALTQEEEDFLKRMTIEEARMRHAKLQKMRALLSYQEAKLKRKAKIKSKKYHKILKQEKLKEKEKQLNEMKNNPNEMLEALAQVDKLRALERASLKHSSTGKWAKYNLLRAKYDSKTREDMVDQMEIKRKMLKRQTVEPEEESEMDDDEDETAQEGEEFMKSGYHEEEAKNPWLLRDQTPATDSTAAVNVTPKVPKLVTDFQAEIPDLQEMGSEDESDDNRDRDEDRKKLLIEAFYDDDLVAEFAQEKREIREKQAAKDIVNFLPGWGSWSGPGIRESRKLIKKKTIRGKRQKRHDDKLKNVIISEDKDAAITKFLVKDLPYHCKDIAKFESKLKKPIGPDWNSVNQFRFNVEPSVITKMGKIIEPINEKALIKKPEAKRRPLDQITKTLGDVISV